MSLKLLITGAAFITVFFANAQQKSFNVTGYVKDAEGETLIHANILDTLSKEGTISNAYGFFSLSLAQPVGFLRVSYIGYQDTLITVSPSSIFPLSIKLTETSLTEVVVSATSNTHNLQHTIQLPLQQLETMPVIGGETDVLKALTFLPGISAGVEGSSGIYVRGGTPDQNLILLDEAPVYNTNHLFGFLSLFNADAIKSVDIIKDGIPARYGGRLSSVINIAMKEGNTKRIRKKFNIGLIASKFSMDGPLFKNKTTSFLLSGRVSYTDLITLPQRISYNAGRTNDLLTFNFYDFNAKINHHINDKNKFFLSFYTGRDNWNSLDRTAISNDLERVNLRWGNITATARLTSQIGEKIFWKNKLIYSNFQYRFKNESDSVEDGFINKGQLTSLSRLQQLSFNSTIEYSPNSKHLIRVGGEASLFYFTPQSNQVLFNDSLLLSQTTKHRTRGLALFVEDELSFNNFLNFNLGLRWNYYKIAETTYSILEPRIATRLRITKHFHAIASFSKMHQALHLLTNSNAGLPNDVWVPATEDTPPQWAWQWTAGLNKYFKHLGIDASIVYFQKNMHHQIDYQDGEGFLTQIGTPWENVIERDGKGWVNGIEAFLHKKTGRWNGLVAYTLSWNERQFANINQGKKYLFRYDRRHDFSIALNYQLSPKWNVAGAWVYSTGNHITFPTAKYPVPESLQDSNGNREYTYYYAQRNGTTLPDFHRFDLNFSYRNKVNKRVTKEWKIGVYNVYNRRNPYYLEITQKPILNDMGETIDRKLGLLEVGLFPIVPSVSFAISF